jgi:hypothetical protein
MSDAGRHSPTRVTQQTKQHSAHEITAQHLIHTLLPHTPRTLSSTCAQLRAFAVHLHILRFYGVDFSPLPLHSHVHVHI